MIQTTEYFTKGKTKNQNLNEDGLIIKEDFVAVIDGATSKSNVTFNGLSGGRFATDILLENLKYIDISSYTSESLFKYLDECIGLEAKNLYSELKHKDYPRASVIIFNGVVGEVWNYGDCKCKIVDKIWNHEKIIDIENSNIRAEIIEEALLNGSTVKSLIKNDIGRVYILERLKNQYKYENIKGKYGYPVLNGYSFDKDMIVVHKVEQGQEVILASDGYPVLEDTLGNSEIILQRIIKEDPLCYKKWKNTKGIKEGNIAADDRTYWRGRYIT